MDDKIALEMLNKPLEQLAISLHNDPDNLAKRHKLILSYIDSIDNDSLAGMYIIGVLLQILSKEQQPEIKRLAGNPNKIAVEPLKIQYYVEKTSKNKASQLLGIDRKSVSNLMTDSELLRTDEKIKKFMDDQYLNDFETDLKAYNVKVGSNK